MIHHPWEIENYTKPTVNKWTSANAFDIKAAITTHPLEVDEEALVGASSHAK